MLLLSSADFSKKVSKNKLMGKKIITIFQSKLLPIWTLCCIHAAKDPCA